MAPKNVALMSIEKLIMLARIGGAAGITVARPQHFTPELINGITFSVDGINGTGLTRRNQ